MAALSPNTEEASAPLLQLIDVTVRRDDTLILDSLNVSIPRHRHTVILGPNGAGKTSLLRILDRQYYPSITLRGHQGSVRILGKEDWEVAQLRRRMGIVAASLDHHFSDGRTGRMRVIEAVASGYTATELPEFGLPITPEIRSAAERALDAVAARNLTERRCSTLSTGERRRVLIARALVHMPDILILDEPTTGLDLAAKDSFLKVLRHLCQQPQLTVVLVTHHMDEIVPEFEHVLLLSNGKIITEGTATRTLTSENISGLYGIPVEVQRQDGVWNTRVVRNSEHSA